MPIWCKIFCQTLGGAARNWFDDLDPKSMNSFEELSQKFLEEFSQLKRYAKDPTEIHDIKRRQNESLQTFMDRFKSKSSQIKWVPSVFRISAFMHDHGHPKLAKKLNDKIPKTVDEMFERKGYFHSTHKTLKEILAMEGVCFPEPPPLIGISKKQNLNKLCDYHEDRGHNTNDCYQLKKQIEEAVASGKLAHLKPKRPYEEERAGLTKELTFPVIPQNSLTDESIILEGMIEGHQIRRIHVDSGSSSEIMYEHCFRSFSTNVRSRLRKCKALLVGFSSETYHPLRLIDLWVTMGEAGRNKTVLIEFAIVNSQRTKESPQWKQAGNPCGSEGRWKKCWARGKKYNGISTWNKYQEYGNKHCCEQGITLDRAANRRPTEKCGHICMGRIRKDSRTTICHGASTESIPPGQPVILKKHDSGYKTRIEGKSVLLAEGRDNQKGPDMFPFPVEEEELASLMGYRYKCFLWLPKDNNQIRMAEDDEEKTGFHTEEGRGSIPRRNGREEQKRTNSSSRCRGNIEKAKEDEHPNQPERIHIQGGRRKVSRVDNNDEGNKGRSRKDTSNNVKPHPQRSEPDMKPIPKAYNHQQVHTKVSKTYASHSRSSKEKMVQPVIHTTRSLRTTFRKHKVRVVTDGLMEEMLKLSRNEGRLAKWAAELRTYDISFIQEKEVKGPVMKRFCREGEQSANGARETIKEGSSVGMILINLDAKTCSYVIRLNFNAPNHIMNYEALLAGLVASAGKGMKDLHVFIDSQIWVDQVEGNIIPAMEQEKMYKEEIMDATTPFHKFRITHLPKILNPKAEMLIGLATIQVEFLNQEVSVGIKTRPTVKMESDEKEKRAISKMPMGKQNYN
ncbi:reverse transcriptase domain-containing protein [Tanacetum coccineum]